MLTERRFINRRSCWPLHTFDDHRLRTHGDRRFIDRRSCWPCITSATTDYTHMENAASSIGDHVDLWRTPLHQPAIMLTFAYLRRPPTTHAWRSSFHRPTIMLALAYLRRAPTTPAWRSPFHRPAIMLTLYNSGEHGGSCLIQTLLDLNLHSSVNTWFC